MSECVAGSEITCLPSDWKTYIRCPRDRRLSVYWKPNSDPPLLKPLNTTVLWRPERFQGEGGPQLSPMMPRDASLWLRLKAAVFSSLGLPKAVFKERDLFFMAELELNTSEVAYVEVHYQYIQIHTEI